MSEEITYQYIYEEDIDLPEYRTFIEKAYGSGCFENRRKRIKFYWQLGDKGFRMLTAKRGNEYLGQSCAYQVELFNIKNNIEMWWGVDSVVLPEMRGLGIGTKLQRQLHSDLPNFSSAWYSSVNGAIKRKCGGKCIAEFPFAYYPVSSYITILLELALKKILSPKITVPRVRLPWLYAMLNKPNRKTINSYEVSTMDLSQLSSMSMFIEECLSNKSFHVVRSKQYLQWKYMNNPLTHCRVLRITKQGKQEGLIVFSEVMKQDVVHSKALVVKIYDIVFTKESRLTYKQLLYYVVDYCRKNGEKLDVIKSLQQTNWFPAFFYPKHKEILSTLDASMFSSSYVTYMDQDMEG